MAVGCAAAALNAKSWFKAADSVSRTVAVVAASSAAAANWPSTRACVSVTEEVGAAACRTAITASTRPPSPTRSPSSRPASTADTHDFGNRAMESARRPPTVQQGLHPPFRKTPVDTNALRLQGGGLGREFYAADFGLQAEEGLSFSRHGQHFTEAPVTATFERASFELYRPACRRLYCQKRTSYVY
ncbi:hypothetical protein ON010_g17333 [Phytophthora cinnamomi]|nr:hypothetical protein ON010_g17333 [Phytophthora cinnamomi]